MKRTLFFPLQISLCTVGYFYAATPIAQAQVTTDGTVNTQVNQNGNIAEITGGETRDSNLFHSFQDFSVPTGNEAFFNNADNISNIFSRVTGGNISNIDGVIRSNGNASLFLINPAGIIFGEGARLDIGGSFYGSSASSILFEGGEFSATDNLEQPILTINAPIGLGFRDNPGDISLEGSSLSVPTGQNLSLLGGDITLSNGSLNAFGGQINLAAISREGVINFDESLNLDFNTLDLGDITLDDGAFINVAGENNGYISVNTRNLTLKENSIFNAGITSPNSTSETQGGDIIVNASASISLESGSIFRNNVNANSAGNAGDIIISANNLSLADNSDISTATQGNGNAGNINLDIADSIVLNRMSRIRSQILSEGIGNGGNIQINSDLLDLDNNSLLIANIIGIGDGGNIQIESNTISLNNNSFFLADVRGQGIGGDININTNSLNILEGSAFSNTVSGQGNAGNINIQATENINLESSLLLTTVAPEGMGNAGNIDITTNSLQLKQGITERPSRLLTNTAGVGDGGNITVNASSIFLEDSSTFQSQVAQGGEGKGGNIEINAVNLELTGESREIQASLLAGSVGTGDAGDIIVNVSENIIFNQFASINNQVSEGSGDAGDIFVNTDNLILANRSLIISGTGDSITPSNNNVGNAGNIDINASSISLDNLSFIGTNSIFNALGSPGDTNLSADTIIVSNGSFISSFTENNSTGGEININAQNLELTTGGKIIALTTSEGNAGNITLNVTEQININGANPFIPPEDIRISGNAPQSLEPFTGLFANSLETARGNGGNIQISDPQNISLSNGGQITVDSQGTGNGGNLFITAGSLDLADQSQLVAETVFGQAEQQPSNINLSIEEDLTLRGDSLISASALNNANGGNINIDANFVIAFPAQVGGNNIIANAREGSGGNVSIAAKGIFGIQERPQNPLSNDIDASSEVDGLDGTVTITNPDVNLTQGVTELNSNVIEPGQNIVQTCDASRRVAGNNELTIKGKGGISPSPDLPLNSQNIIINGATNTTSTTPQPIETSHGKIQPARGIKVTESGEIILTAYRTDNSGQRLPEIKLNCS